MTSLPGVTLAPAAKESAPDGTALVLVAFLLDGQRYALPLSTVERVLPMAAVAPLPTAPAIALGVLNLHGHAIPVIDLRRRLGCPPKRYGSDDQLVLVRTRRRRLALPVDAALGVLTVSADEVIPPHRVLPGLEQLAGIVALADGLLFLENLDALLSLDEDARLGRALEEKQA